MLPQLIEHYGSDQVLFMDESGINSTDVARYGWSHQSTRCKAVMLGGYGKRISVMGAVSLTAPFRFLAPMVFDGYCDRSVFGAWLEHLSHGLPKDKLGTIKPHVLILDNASFHKGPQIEALAQSYNIRLFYLPTYSPQLNPEPCRAQDEVAERCWSVLKAKLRQLNGKGLLWEECFFQAFAQM